MQKISKKERILHEALKLFATQGVGSTSTAEITKSAGVAEGTLFVHFKNKQALVDEVYLYIKKREGEVFEKAVTDAATAEEFVRTLGKTVVKHFIKNFNELIFLQNVTLLKLVSKSAQKETNKHFDILQEKMMSWQKKGDVKQMEPEVLRRLVWAMFISLIHYCKTKRIAVTSELIDPVWDAVRVR